MLHTILSMGLKRRIDECLFDSIDELARNLHMTGSGLILANTSVIFYHEICVIAEGLDLSKSKSVR